MGIRARIRVRQQAAGYGTRWKLRIMTDGCPMCVRWMSDGCQMDVGHLGTRWKLRARDGLSFRLGMCVRWLSDVCQMGVGHLHLMSFRLGMCVAHAKLA